MSKNIWKKIYAFLKGKVPRFFHRFGPKKYTTKFLLAALILKQYFKLTYRQISELFEISGRKIPHFTTFQKALKRFEESWLAKFLLSKAKISILGIDATGFSARHASAHYSLRIGKILKKRDFVKLSIAFAVKERKIVSAFSGKLMHDNLFFKKHLAEAPQFSFLVADKAYDSNENFRIVKNLSAKCFIPLRKNRRGLFAKIVAKKFNAKIYHQRSLVESVFSSLKRKFGSELLSVNFGNQKKELLLKCLAYNIFVLFWTFSTAPWVYIIYYLSHCKKYNQYEKNSPRTCSCNNACFDSTANKCPD